MKKLLFLVGIIVIVGILYVFIRTPAPAPTSAPAPEKAVVEASSTVAEPRPTPTPTPQPRMYSRAQVAEHNGSLSCWAIVRGGVYDLTSWIAAHPGGAEAILSLCGTDGTAAFEAQHSGQQRPEKELVGFKIGIVTQ